MEEFEIFKYNCQQDYQRSLYLSTRLHGFIVQNTVNYTVLSSSAVRVVFIFIQVALFFSLPPKQKRAQLLLYFTILQPQSSHKDPKRLVFLLLYQLIKG
jgi:hypothetical protein